MKKPRLRVRFHLGAGEHYMHWQVRYPNGDVQFFNPDTTHLLLLECQLHVQKGIAKTVNTTGKKLVCGWIWCEEVRTIFWSDKGESIKFNPVVDPDWLINGQVSNGAKISRIQTIGKKLIAL